MVKSRSNKKYFFSKNFIKKKIQKNKKYLKKVTINCYIMKRTLFNDMKINVPKKIKIEYINYKTKKELETIFLNDEKTSWVTFQKLHEDDGLRFYDFDKIWTIKPLRQFSDPPRYFKCFLRNYVTTDDENLSPFIKKMINFSKSFNPNFKNCLAIWIDENGYIGKNLELNREIKNEKMIFTFGPSRNFLIFEPKIDGKPIKIEIEHNSFVLIGGRTNKTHHYFLKKEEESKKRFNLIFN